MSSSRRNDDCIYSDASIFPKLTRHVCLYSIHTCHDSACVGYPCQRSCRGQGAHIRYRIAVRSEHLNMVCVMTLYSDWLSAIISLALVGQCGGVEKCDGKCTTAPVWQHKLWIAMRNTVVLFTRTSQVADDS